MPTGKVKWYDTDKGFGFISREDGGDVFVPKSALPADVPALRPGARVEFGIVEGRRGEQAMQVRVLDPMPSLAKALRRSPDEITPILEDLIKLLDNLSNTYRRGRHPEPKAAQKVASVLRAVADDIDV